MQKGVLPSCMDRPQARISPDFAPTVFTYNCRSYTSVWMGVRDENPQRPRELARVRTPSPLPAAVAGLCPDPAVAGPRRGRQSLPQRFGRSEQIYLRGPHRASRGLLGRALRQHLRPAHLRGQRYRRDERGLHLDRQLQRPHPLRRQQLCAHGLHHGHRQRHQPLCGQQKPPVDRHQRRGHRHDGAQRVPPLGRGRWPHLPADHLHRRGRHGHHIRRHSHGRRDDRREAPALPARRRAHQRHIHREPAQGQRRSRLRPHPFRRSLLHPEWFGRHLPRPRGERSQGHHPRAARPEQSGLPVSGHGDLRGPVRQAGRSVREHDDQRHNAAIDRV